MPSCKKCCPVHLWPLPTSPSKNSETSYTSYCSPPLPPNSHISNYLLVPTTVTNCPAYNKCHHTHLSASGRGLAWTNLTPAHNAAPLDSAWNSSRCHFISTGSAEEVLRNCPYPHIRLSGLQQPCYKELVCPTLPDTQQLCMDHTGQNLFCTPWTTPAHQYLIQQTHFHRQTKARFSWCHSPVYTVCCTGDEKSTGPTQEGGVPEKDRGREVEQDFSSGVPSNTAKAAQR